MKIIAIVSVELIALVAIMPLIQLVLLLLRNPFRSGLLRRAGIETVTAVAIVAAISFSLAFLINGLANAGVDVFAAMVTALACASLSWWGFWRLFGVGERLRRAEAGRNPFHRLGAGSGGKLGGHTAH